MHGTGTEGDNVAGQAAGWSGADEDSTGTAVRTSRQEEGTSGEGMSNKRQKEGSLRGVFISHSYLDIPLIS